MRVLFYLTVKKIYYFWCLNIKIMKIKHLICGFALVCCGLFSNAQSSSDLVNHYKIYYAQMQKLGDSQGIINALSHLLILEPNVARQDTLAAYYMNEGKYVQALSILGVQPNEKDTDLSIEVKAVCLKSLNEPARALEQYELLFQRRPTASLAYELADLKIQMNDLTAAGLNITYGIANSPNDMMKPYYETQTPYQVPLKVAFLYLKAIAKFRENPNSNHDAALAILDEALRDAPQFNLATLAKTAIENQKKVQSK